MEKSVSLTLHRCPEWRWMSSISLNLLLGIRLLKLWVSVQAEMELWKASGPEVRGPFWQASSNTNLILGPHSSLHVKQNLCDRPKPDCCIYFCCISLILIWMQEVRNLNSKSALPQPRSLLSVPENLAESSHHSEKRALVWQIWALFRRDFTRAWSQRRSSWGSASADPRPVSVRTAGSYQSSGQHADVRSRLMWHFHP